MVYKSENKFVFAFLENANDPTLQFFLSMAQEARKLPDAIRLELQLKIMQATIAAAEEARKTV